MLRFETFCKKIAILLSLLAAIIGININSGWCESQTPTIENKVQKPLAERLPPVPGLYASDSVPLTPTQCGQCHASTYRDLKINGGRHTLKCDSCHTKYHAYNPSKQNWQDLMPKCTTCHTTPPHGVKFNNCSDCHNNPHAPKQLPMNSMLVNSCSSCHSAPFEQMLKNPSAHSKLQCRDCHTSHGLIPNCKVCHKPHFQGQEFKNCASECHPVHMPREIKYKIDVNPRTCGACHSAIFAKWSASPSKHAGVNCAACHHSKHGFIPACIECHTLPHSKGLHQLYPNCLTCHQDPHDPPVKQRSK